MHHYLPINHNKLLLPVTSLHSIIDFKFNSIQACTSAVGLIRRSHKYAYENRKFKLFEFFYDFRMIVDKMAP